MNFYGGGGEPMKVTGRKKTVFQCQNCHHKSYADYDEI